MSPRTAVLVVVGALVLAVAAWMVWAPSGDEEVSPKEEPETSNVAIEIDEDTPTSPALLYFPDAGGLLQGVDFEAPSEDEETRIRVLVNALLAGPGEFGADSLTPPLPEGARLDGLYFIDETSVALDLRLLPATDSTEADAQTEAPEAEASEMAQTTIDEATAASFFGRFGSKQELLAVYSLVNTVAMGSEKVEQVVLILDGKQPETLAGHIDLTRPLRPDPSWIRP